MHYGHDCLIPGVGRTIRQRQDRKHFAEMGLLQLT